MSDNFITSNQVQDWFIDLEEALKNQIVNTQLKDNEDRENAYFLYQAAQLLKARFLEDFSEEIEIPVVGYDNERWSETW
jgi:hypothetical protein